MKWKRAEKKSETQTVTGNLCYKPEDGGDHMESIRRNAGNL